MKKTLLIFLSVIISIFLLIIIALFFTISNYGRSEPRLRKWKHPINIPSADIVFNTISEPEEGKLFGKEILGFYFLEDQSVTTLELPNGSSPIRPYYLESETIMTSNEMGNNGSVNEGQTHLSIFSANQYLNCNKFDGGAFPHNGNILFYGDVDGFESISIINKNDCSVVKTILDSDDLSALKGYGVGFRAFSINEDYTFLGSKDLGIFKINLSDKKIFDHKKEGFATTLSPDQKKSPI